MLIEFRGEGKTGGGGGGGGGGAWGLMGGNSIGLHCRGRDQNNKGTILQSSI